MDEPAFVAIFDATVHDVYRYASRLAGNDRHHADDLVQDAYAALAAELQAGRLARVGTGWLITVVRNRHIDQLRRSEREQRKGMFGASATVSDAEPLDFAGDLLAGLAPDQRTALVLRYVDDLPVPAVAAALGRSVHATESLLARGRDALRAKETHRG